MSGYAKSQEAFPSNLHLWDPFPTNTAIAETRVMDFFPSSSIESSDTITFTIPAMHDFMLQGVEVVSEIQVLRDGLAPPANNDVGTSPHIAASLWRNVNVTIGNSSLCQSFDNSYAMFKFWDQIIHDGQKSFSTLYRQEGMSLDHVKTKAASENVLYYPPNPEDLTPAPAPVNKNGHWRAERIKEGRKVCLVSDLNVPIFKQSKLLPPDMEIKVHLTKNYPEFILLCPTTKTETVKFLQVSLRCTFQRPTETVLNIIEERLAKENAIYHADKKILTFHSLTQGSNEVTIDNVFFGELPYFFLYGVQDRASFGKARNKNPFTLHKMKYTNVYVNGQPHFPKRPEVAAHDDTFMYSAYIDQIGVKSGDTLLNEFYEAYPIMACDLTQDRSQNRHGMNLSKNGAVSLTIGFPEELPADRVLMVLAYYDQIIEISKDRQVTFV